MDNEYVYGNADSGYEISHYYGYGYGGPAEPAGPPKPPRKPRKKVALGRFAAVAMTVGIGAACFGVGISVGKVFTPTPTPAAVAMATQTPVITEAPFSYNTATAKAPQTAPAETPAPTVAPATEAPQAVAKAAPSETPASLTSNPTYAALTGADQSFVSDVYKTVSPSVVSINVKATVTTMFNQTYSQDAAGSGIIFKEDSDKVYIVTNYHVIDGASEASVSLNDTDTVPANFVGGSQSNDIAVISVAKADMKSKFPNYTVAAFADSDKIAPGSFAIAIGNALGEGKSVTFGVISAVNKQIQDENQQMITVIQTDAAINPGNSGGALSNTSGQVIGINTAKLSSVGIEGMGYAIPSNTVAQIANNILQQGKTQTPYIGIETYTITANIAQMYNLPTTGVYINNVQRGSGAADAGLRVGDIITKVNGVAVTDSDQLLAAIQQGKVGDTITLSINRNGRTGDVKVALKNQGLDF